MGSKGGKEKDLRVRGVGFSFRRGIKAPPGRGFYHPLDSSSMYKCLLGWSLLAGSSCLVDMCFEGCLLYTSRFVLLEMGNILEICAGI